MTKTPDWPFKCPKEGWYLSKVEAIWPEDCDLSYVDCDCDPAIPLLVYGTCKQHGLVWLSNMEAYEPKLWKEKYEQGKRCQVGG